MKFYGILKPLCTLIYTSASWSHRSHRRMDQSSSLPLFSFTFRETEKVKVQPQTTDNYRSVFVFIDRHYGYKPESTELLTLEKEGERTRAWLSFCWLTRWGWIIRKTVNIEKRSRKSQSRKKTAHTQEMREIEKGKVKLRQSSSALEGQGRGGGGGGGGREREREIEKKKKKKKKHSGRAGDLHVGVCRFESHQRRPS